jgi:hypothetical protein
MLEGQKIFGQRVSLENLIFRPGVLNAKLELLSIDSIIHPCCSRCNIYCRMQSLLQIMEVLLV